jgi:dTMP kinase
LDGSGKSTVATKLADAFCQLGSEVVVTREPGGTPLGERVREILLGPVAETIDPAAEALLFAAARAQHVAEIIRPALARGAVVVADRYVDSSLAYQGHGRGLPESALAAVQQLATGGLQPDLTLLLDLPVETALHRRLVHGGHVNRLDAEPIQFHALVRDAYHALAAANPRRWRVIDASASEDDVWLAVRGEVFDVGQRTAEPAVVPTHGCSKVGM